MNLSQSKRTAQKFVLAEKGVVNMPESISDELRSKAQERFHEAAEALQNDPIAQQLLPSAREFDHRRQLRLETIRQTTLLGKFAERLADSADYDAELAPTDFKESLIDDEYARLCEALGEMDPVTALKVASILSELLDSLIVDIGNAKLPPAPKFVI